MVINGCQFNDCVNNECYEGFDRQCIGHSFLDFFYNQGFNLF
jgi:hypothetical protein